MQIILDTIKSLLHPIFWLASVQMIIFYFFAQIGIFMFGGLVKKELTNVFNTGSDSIPSLYYLNNFNDLLSAYLTLFSLMVVNNWQLTVNMYVTVMSGNTTYRLYFYLFYYVSVIVGVNLVIAYAIDMYTSVERIDEQRTQTMHMLMKKLRISNDTLHDLRSKLRETKEETPGANVTNF